MKNNGIWLFVAFFFSFNCLNAQIDRIKKVPTTTTTTTETSTVSHANSGIFTQKLNNDYIKMTLRLPFATQDAEYMVRKDGHYFILNDDVIVGNDFPKTQSYSTNNKDYKWRNAEIPVLIDNSIFDKNMQGMVYAALNAMNRQLELNIVPRVGQEDYVRIQFSSTIKGAGQSAVGRQGGEQPLFLSSGASQATIWHELLHAAGIWHEQSRSDRNNFVRIHTENLLSGTENNFQTEPGNTNSGYDYCSIMHYSSMAFSKNNQATIECLSNGTTTTCPPCMGQRNGFSAQDISGLDRFYNEVSRFPSNYTFAPPTDAVKGIASVSRQANTMENWWIDKNGTIQAAFWYEGNNWNRYQLGNLGGASVNGGIAAVSRAANTMEVWWVGSNGSVQAAFWYEGSPWKYYELAPAGSAALTSRITAVSRAKGTMELWWVGANGSVQGAFWYDGQPWKRYELAPANSAALNGGLNAVSRAAGTMELWWIANNGSVQAAFWYEGQPWKRYELAGANSASLNGGITAVSRLSNAMELWFVGSNGSLQGKFWYEGQPWKGYELAPAGSVSANSGIDAVARIKNSMEIWYVGANGSIQGKYWYEGGTWNGYELAPAGSATTASGIAAVSRAPSTLELWWIGNNGTVQSGFWYDKSTWKRYELAAKR